MSIVRPDFRYVLPALRTLRPLIGMRTEYVLRRAACRFIPVKSRATADAAFHCCVWKTGSQWIRLVLSDPRLYRYTGLRPIAVGNSREIESDSNLLSIPNRSVVTNFYCSRDTYLRVVKPEDSRVFFVFRDPRRILVSWYYSTRYSHRMNPAIRALRAEYDGLSEREGFEVAVRQFEQASTIIRSWLTAAGSDSSLLLVRFEDLVSDRSVATWEQIFRHFGATVPADVIRKVLTTYHKDVLAAGRGSGKANKYESASGESWDTSVPALTRQRFLDLHGDLIESLGYEL